MKIVLLASDRVGLGVPECFRDNGVPLAALVLDSGDRGGRNGAIVSASGIQDPDRIFHSDALYEPRSMDRLLALDLDLAMLAWWSYIVKEPLLSAPRRGCMNLHPSYLPYNRGRDAKYWTVVEDTPFGVTLHYIDTGVDTGDVIFRHEIEKSWEDTGQTLADRAERGLIELFRRHFAEIIAETVPRISQDHASGSFRRKVEALADSRLDLDETVVTRELLNKLRAKTCRFEKGAWFVDDGVEYEVSIEIKRYTSEGEGIPGASRPGTTSGER